MSYFSEQRQTVYQCNDDLVDSLHKVREAAYQSCIQCLNRPVQIQTIHGQNYEGTLVNVDHQHAYLMVSDTRGYYYNNVILPLVLFELLVIALL